jgi:hypothetical protein
MMLSLSLSLPTPGALGQRLGDMLGRRGKKAARGGAELGGEEEAGVRFA